MEKRQNFHDAFVETVDLPWLFALVVFCYAYNNKSLNRMRAFNRSTLNKWKQREEKKIGNIRYYSAEQIKKMNKTFYVCQRHNIKIEFSCFSLRLAHSISLWFGNSLVAMMYQPSKINVTKK